MTLLSENIRYRFEKKKRRKMDPSNVQLIDFYSVWKLIKKKKWKIKDTFTVFTLSKLWTMKYSMSGRNYNLIESLFLTYWMTNSALCITLCMKFPFSCPFIYRNFRKRSIDSTNFTEFSIFHFRIELHQMGNVPNDIFIENFQLEPCQSIWKM